MNVWDVTTYDQALAFAEVKAPGYTMDGVDTMIQITSTRGEATLFLSGSFAREEALSRALQLAQRYRCAYTAQFEKFRGDRLTLYAALDYEQAAAVWAGWEQLYNGCRRVFGATLPLIWDVMRKEGTIDY